MENVLSYMCLGKLLRCTNCYQRSKDEKSKVRICSLFCQCGACLFKQREHCEQITEVFVKERNKLEKVLNTDKSNESLPNIDIKDYIDKILKTIKAEKADDCDKCNDKTKDLRRIGTDKDGRTLFLKEIGYFNDEFTEENENNIRVSINQYAEKNEIEPEILNELKKLPIIISNSNNNENKKKSKRRMDCFFCSFTRKLAEKVFGCGALAAY